MAGYKLTIKPSVADDLGGIGQRKDRQRLIEKISKLAEDPRPAECRRLAGAQDYYRIRQGDYRIVYAVADATQTIDVVKIGHRRDVYRNRS